MTRLRSPIKPRGAVAQRWAKWHERSRQAVLARSHWRCEGCGTTMRPLEWAHLVGRNNKGIGEPWCSTPELTAALCSGKWDEMGCHEKIDRALDLDLLDRLRSIAWVRLLEDYSYTGTTLAVASPDPLDSIRTVVRLLQEQWVWDGERINKVEGGIDNLA